MEESVTYQEILQKGIAQGKWSWEAEERGRMNMARRILMRLALKRFSDLPPFALLHVAALTTPVELETLILRLPDVQTWDELLANTGS